MSEPKTDPTGLDYHEAYKAMFPGLVTDGIRIQDLQDTHLKTVDRAARLRRQERERVKEAFLVFATSLEAPDQGPLSPDVVADLIRETAKEIR